MAAEVCLRLFFHKGLSQREVNPFHSKHCHVPCWLLAPHTEPKPCSQFLRELIWAISSFLAHGAARGCEGFSILVIIITRSCTCCLCHGTFPNLAGPRQRKPSSGVILHLLFSGLCWCFRGLCFHGGLWLQRKGWWLCELGCSSST